MTGALLARRRYHASFRNLGMALLTLFRICTADNWSEVMHAASLTLEARPVPDPLGAVREHLVGYNSTGDVREIRRARLLLPGCQSAEELAALDEFVSCRHRDRLTGQCPSTCGSKAFSSILFSMFLCAGNFVLLNLVMAVLMQELQASLTAAASREQNKSLSVLLSVSAATSKWLKLAGDDEKHDAAPDGAPGPPGAPGAGPPGSPLSMRRGGGGSFAGGLGSPMAATPQ